MKEKKLPSVKNQMEPQMAATRRDLMAEVGDSFFFCTTSIVNTSNALQGRHLQQNQKQNCCIITFLCLLWLGVSMASLTSSVVTSLHDFHNNNGEVSAFISHLLHKVTNVSSQSSGCSCFVENQVHGGVTKYVLFSKDILSWAFCNFIKKII